MAQDQRWPEGPAAAERRFVEIRRAKAGVKADAPLAGLAFSGGGIRSATFSLGVQQGLAKLGVLKRFDLMSTVSGGGYAGSFLGALYCRKAGSVEPDPAMVEAGLGAPQAPAAEGPRAIHESVGWLRENGRYLTPGGSGDGFWAGAMMLRNLVAVHLVMGLLWLLAFLLGDQLLGRTAWMGAFPGVDLWGWTVQPSPWLVPLPFVAGLALPLGWAYWLVRQPAVAGQGAMVTRPWLTALVFSPWALATGWMWMEARHLPALGGGLVLAGGLSVAALLAWAILGRGGSEAAQLRLTAALRLVFVAVVVGLLLVLVDTLAWTIHARIFPAARAAGEGWSRLGEHLSQAGEALRTPGGAAAGLLAALAAFKDKFMGLLGAAEKGGWKDLLLRILLNAAAGVVGLAGLAFLAALAHAFAFGGAQPAGPGALGLQSDAAFWILLVGLVVFNLLLGRTIGFLNLSTLGPTYTAALTRAYVGASHAKRREGDSTPHPIPGDDLAWADYRPWERGGPLHVINVTLNETTGGRSQVLQKDRKGMNLAVGPAGLTVGVRHHAAWETGFLRGVPRKGFSVFPEGQLRQPEALTLGQWVGISGAAFSTGLGSRTTWATSLLAGFLNVRLGYWWWSGGEGSGGVRGACEGLLPVQTHLMEEWLGLFPGTHSRHWYLSDGGHFENTAAYELIRRRVPFILLCDDGADPGRGMGDLANLVAKARLDLAARVTVLDDAALAAFFSVRGKAVPSCIGSLEDLRDAKHPALASLVRLDYLDERGAVESEGWMLLLKPTLAPDLPLDVAAYAQAHKDFPQQSTLDQFFDEAQWESYRALGEHIAVTVLTAAPDLIPA
jgi:hypothetical protein